MCHTFPLSGCSVALDGHTLTSALHATPSYALRLFENVWSAWMFSFSGCVSLVVSALGPTLDFSVEIPAGLAEVFECVSLLPGAPDVFHGVTQTEVHVLRNCDAFHATGVFGVVLRMVYGVVR